MIQATAVRCQQCGAAALPVSGREYLQCGSCHALIFDATNPLAIDQIQPVSGAINVPCPSCTETLKKGQIDGRPALYCGGCYGLLLRNSDFANVVRDRRARRNAAEIEACRPLDSGELVRNIACPNCAREMETHPYYGPGNIVIDSCAVCEYIWLDHGELRTAERVEGGLESRVSPGQTSSIATSAGIGSPENYAPGFCHQSDPLSVIADTIFGN